MRKITRDAVDAFYLGHHFTRSNTAVRVTDEGSVLFYLHGNMIAYRDWTGVHVRHARWRTSTTKERLNGILKPRGLVVYQSGGVWYLAGVDGAMPVEFDALADVDGWVNV